MEVRFVELTTMNISNYLKNMDITKELTQIWNKKRYRTELYRIMPNTSPYFFLLMNGNMYEMKEYAKKYMKQDGYKGQYLLISRTKMYITVVK